MGLPKKVDLEWMEEMDKGFNQVKATTAEDTRMAYPNHNLLFYIYTYASNYQRGACVMWGSMPVVYFSMNLIAPPAELYNDKERISDNSPSRIGL